MNVARSGVGLCVFNSNFIFAFGGRNAMHNHLKIIESYDISKNIWQEINLVNSDLWEEGSYLCQAHQISKNKIIIFGKSAHPSEESIKSCYEFTPDTGELTEGKPLEMHSAFVNSGICYNDNLFFVGRGFKIHKYSLIDQKWSIYN